jgi:hypothetical protein
MHLHAMFSCQFGAATAKAAVMAENTNSTLKPARACMPSNL